MKEVSVASVRVGEALLQVGAGLDGRVAVGPVAAADDGLIVRVQEEGQRLPCAGVSSRGQQHPVRLSVKGSCDQLINEVTWSK